MYIQLEEGRSVKALNGICFLKKRRVSEPNFKTIPKIFFDGIVFVLHDPVYCRRPLAGVHILHTRNSLFMKEFEFFGKPLRNQCKAGEPTFTHCRHFSNGTVGPRFHRINHRTRDVFEEYPCLADKRTASKVINNYFQRNCKDRFQNFGTKLMSR